VAFHGKVERATAGKPSPQVQGASKNWDSPLDQVHSIADCA